ncbi:MAG: ATP-binding protein [Gloeobacterales cyanobacterium]
MFHQIENTAQFLQYQAASLLVYQGVLSGEVGSAFLELLKAIDKLQHSFEHDKKDYLYAYGRWFYALAHANQSWQDYLVEQILHADNPFTQQVQQCDLEDLSPALLAAAKHDLQSLHCLYKFSSEHLEQWIEEVFPSSYQPIFWSQDASTTLDTFSLHRSENWPAALPDLATQYRTRGTGLFAEYQALQWHAGQLIGVAYPDQVRISDLVGYADQRDQLLKNTEALLSGYPALHVLLYGSRGSGKSSFVKSLLTEYGERGLRLVEVTKSELINLPIIVDQLRRIPNKFILFVDDLSFEEDEDTYKALKVVLEGNLTARPQNVVVYATSNRRHLIREFFGDRPQPGSDDEVHGWDTVQEKLSLSDRFGLTLTFIPADQKLYLDIVHHLAKQAGLSLHPKDLEFQALQWALQHNGRSGRTARQFIDFMKADLARSQSKPRV